MGFTCRFLHNQVYSAQEVNQAFSRLTSQGVSLFSDTGDPLTDLNTAVSNLVTDGIELDYDACKVVSAGGGSYKVMPGTAIMPNGEMITVDTDGYTFTAGTGTAWDVVMAVEANQGIIRAQTADAPANGILIAQISAAGAVTDRRTFATTKVAPSTGNIVTEEELEMSFLASSSNTYTLDVGWGGFNYVLAANKDKSAYKDFIRVENGEEVSYLQVDTSYRIHVTKNGDKVNLRTQHTGVGGGYATVQFTFI